jgi:hypothetical protein
LSVNLSELNCSVKRHFLCGISFRLSNFYPCPCKNFLHLLVAFHKSHNERMIKPTLHTIAGLFLLPLSALAQMDPATVVFPTNLERPLTVIAPRDSINYPLSRDLIAAISIINKDKPASQQIKLRTFGWNYPASSVKEAGYEFIPAQSILDIKKENAKITFPWFSHSMEKVEPWFQDAFEFFYDSTGVGAVSFRMVKGGESFLTPEEKIRLAEILKIREQGTAPEHVIGQGFTEESEIGDRATARAAIAHTKFEVKLLGRESHQIGDHVLSGSSTVKGGDFEVLPKDVIVIGDHPSNVEELLKNTRYERNVIEFDSSLTMVQHVDEFISVVPANNACGFSLLSFDTNLGLATLKKETADQVQSLIPPQYQTSVPKGSEISNASLKALYRFAVRGDTKAQKLGKPLAEIQKRAANQLSPVLAKFKKDYARYNPACKDLPIISLPVLMNCGESSPLTYCQPMVPNPVNSVVLGKDILVPDPYLPSFRQEIRTRLEAIGLRVFFIDAGLFHGHAGAVHCATNVIRASR